ncbi:MAG: hypothetical protein AB1589_19000 [Cyanobacteriota bacterium]
MFYLAEVQKPAGLRGHHQPQLKLLACQYDGKRWSALPNEEVINVWSANQFNAGVVVIVELSPNRQVWNIQSAALYFSRLQNYWQAHLEEIEQWKQSLEHHRQELNYREMKALAWLDKIEILQELQCHEIERDHQETEKLRIAIEHHRKKLQKSLARVKKRQSQLQIFHLQKLLHGIFASFGLQQVILHQHWQKFPLFRSFEDLGKDR